MKKAILIEPKLLAKIKQKSPAVYEYYSKSPPMLFKFVEFGSHGFNMFIQKEAMDCLESLPKHEGSSVDRIIGALQIGYILGHRDLKKRFPGDNSEPLQGSILIGVTLNLALNYPYYYVEDLLNPDNLETRDKFCYHTLSYKESQYFTAWDIIFSRHEDFNDLFVLINKKRKRENLDNMGKIDFSAIFN